MKLYRIKKTYYYYHRTHGWFIYRKSDWQYSLNLGFYDEYELLEIVGAKKATSAEFKKNTGKDVRRTIKTFAQRKQRAQQRLKELLNGTRIIKDDTKLFCGE